MSEITTATDRAILRDRLGDLEVRIFSTGDPHRIEAESVIGGETVTLSVVALGPILQAGPHRDAAVEMLGFGFLDRLVGVQSRR